jgi:hypothetical protein
MLVGREIETRRLREAILERQSLLVHGPADSGKTSLLEETLAGLPSPVRGACIVCGPCDSPRSIWRQLVHGLASIRDSQVLTRVRRECGPAESLSAWLQRQSSLRLRGILRQAMRGQRYCVFFDTISPLPDGVYRVLQEWVWSGRTPVFLLARGATVQEIGRVARLFWHQGLRLELGPLQRNDLNYLLDECIERFRLTSVAGQEFRSFVLEQCAGLPGRIARLCEMASQRAYHSDGHLKLHTLAIDFVAQTKRGPHGVLRAGRND